jgi:hypothetical protein
MRKEVFGMFDNESLREWINGLSGRDKEYVRQVLRNYAMKHDDATCTEALIYARKAMILRNAINTIAYVQLKTPSEVWNEMFEKERV